MESGVGTLRLRRNVARGPRAFDQGDLGLGRDEVGGRTVH